MWKTWFPDRASAFALLGSLAFLVLFLVALPRWLHGQEQDDLRGSLPTVARGVVVTPQLSPVNASGRTFFNAVTIAYAGRKAFVPLPVSGTWEPTAGEPVTVTYRIARSGRATVDKVVPVSGPHP